MNAATIFSIAGVLALAVLPAAGVIVALGMHWYTGK